MADRKASHNNVLRQTIREQLEKPSNPVSSSQKTYAPLETKESNGLKNLFSKLLGQKEQEGVVISNQKISAKQDIQFGKFEDLGIEENKENKLEVVEVPHQDLSALTKPQNKIEELPQELQESTSGLNQFEQEIQDNGQGLQEFTGEVNQFEGEIQDKGKELPIAEEVSLFEGEIQDKGKELPIAKEVSLFEGEIQDNGKELPIAKEVSLFEEKIEDKGKELPIAKEDSLFEGKIEDKEASKKRKADDAIAAESSEARVLVEVSFNEDGELIDINKFVTAQPTKRARTIGLNSNKKIANKVARAKKGARKSKLNGSGVNLTR